MRIRNFWTVLVLVSAIGSPAWADDFCPNLKKAIAAAPTNFVSISGDEDDFIPGWRNAKIMLPFATDCTVTTDSRDISYFCYWKKEQSGAVSARYKYLVQQTDQCLAGFQKTVGDALTTWQRPAGGHVTVSARHVMKKDNTWSVSLTVRR